MYENEPNGQDTIPTILNGKVPNESAIFALHACLQRTRDEERNNRKSESSRLCCAARFPEKPVCYGNAAGNWSWVNRGCSNQYPYSSNYQSYVRECPVQYYCPTCQSREKEVVEEKCCNKQVETIITWPCCYCSQLTSERTTKKASDKKQNCRNVETQCKCSNEEIIHSSIDGTGDSQSTKKDAVEQSSSETELLNGISNEADQKESRKVLIKKSGEVQPVSNKTSGREPSNKKKLDSEQSKSTTEQNVSKKSDKKPGKYTSQSRSQGKLGEDSAANDIRFKGEIKKAEESVINKGKSKIPKSVSNIDEYASQSSKISTMNDKKMKSMIPTPNGRRVAESKGVEPREKSSVRKNVTDVDVKKSYVLSSNTDKSNKKNDINKNESVNDRKSNGVKRGEKIEKPNPKDLDKLDINKSYVLNSKNNKSGKTESNVKKETMGISNNKLSQDKSGIKKKQESPKPLKNDKIDKTNKVQSLESYRDSESVVEVNNLEEDQIAKKEKPSKCDDSIGVDINKSYVLYSNDNNKPTSSKNLKSNEVSCNCCCCCKHCDNANNNKKKKTAEASKNEDVSDTSSGEAVSRDDSDNSACSCSSCSCSDITEDESKQQQILNQKQKKKIEQNDNVEIVKKQACKRKVEFAKKDKINKIFNEKDPSIEINDENILPDLERNEKNKKSALQSLSKQAAVCPVCPCCGVKLDGILDFYSKKTKQSTVSREYNVRDNKERDTFAVNNGTQYSLQKIGNYNNVSTEFIVCSCDNNGGFNKKENRTVNNSTQNNVINYKNERTKFGMCVCDNNKDINSKRKNLGADNNTQNNVDNIVNKLNCLCNKNGSTLDTMRTASNRAKNYSMDKPCTCPNIREYAVDQNQCCGRCDNNDISNSSTSDSISYATNSEQIETCRPVCKKLIPCVKNIDNKCNSNNSKSRSGSMLEENKIVSRNRNTTVSRSTEVDVGPDTIQQARQRSMNTYVCAEDIETTHRICSC